MVSCCEPSFILGNIFFFSFYSLCSFSVIFKGKESANPLIFHHTLYTHLFFFFFFFFWGRETNFPCTKFTLQVYRQLLSHQVSHPVGDDVKMRHPWVVRILVPLCLLLVLLVRHASGDPLEGDYFNNRRKFHQNSSRGQLSVDADRLSRLGRCLHRQ